MKIPLDFQIKNQILCIQLTLQKLVKRFDVYGIAKYLFIRDLYPLLYQTLGHRRETERKKEKRERERR